MVLSYLYLLTCYLSTCCITDFIICNCDSMVIENLRHTHGRLSAGNLSEWAIPWVYIFIPLKLHGNEYSWMFEVVLSSRYSAIVAIRICIFCFDLLTVLNKHKNVEKNGCPIWYYFRCRNVKMAISIETAKPVKYNKRSIPRKTEKLFKCSWLIFK